MTSQRQQSFVVVGQGNLDVPAKNRAKQNENEQFTAFSDCQQNRENATAHKRTMLAFLKFLEDMVGIGHNTTQEQTPAKRIANLEEEILPAAPETKAPSLKRLETLEANAKKLAECV